MDLRHVAHKTQPRVALFRFQQQAVGTGKAQGAAAVFFHEAYESTVHLADEGHLDDVHGLFVRDAQALDEDGLFAHFLHDGADFGAPAVDEDHLDADEAEQDQVLHDLLPVLLVENFMAASRIQLDRDLCMPGPLQLLRHLQHSY